MVGFSGKASYTVRVLSTYTFMTHIGGLYGKLQRKCIKYGKGVTYIYHYDSRWKNKRWDI